eukprot:6062579-Prorocentrum_lima.AAC.1
MDNRRGAVPHARCERWPAGLAVDRLASWVPFFTTAMARELNGGAGAQVAIASLLCLTITYQNVDGQQ